jgi:MarR family transcriptional regulator, lower aerobic nicotinate degradation pathway regulator
VSPDDTFSLPKALSGRAAYLLGRAATQLHAMGERDLEPLGISPREYSVLAVLAERSPLSQTRIGTILGLDRTTILKLGASLEEKGLVVRERDETDRRAYAIALTNAGEQVRSQAFTLLLDCEERFLTPLAGSERDELTQLLGRIVEM